MIQKLLRLKSNMLSDKYDPLWPKLTEEEWETAVKTIIEIFKEDLGDLQYERDVGYDRGWEDAYPAAYQDGYDEAVIEANRIFKQAREALRW